MDVFICCRLCQHGHVHLLQVKSAWTCSSVAGYVSMDVFICYRLCQHGRVHLLQVMSAWTCSSATGYVSMDVFICYRLCQNGRVHLFQVMSAWTCSSVTGYVSMDVVLFIWDQYFILSDNVDLRKDLLPAYMAVFFKLLHHRLKDCDSVSVTRK